MLANRNIVEIGLRGCKQSGTASQICGANAATSVAHATAGPTGKAISSRSQMMGCWDFFYLCNHLYSHLVNLKGIGLPSCVQMWVITALA